jgi:hypothetical protein
MHRVFLSLRCSLPVFPRKLSSPVLALCVLALAACSKSTDPENRPPSSGGAHFTGSIDPGTQSFVLESVDIPVPDGVPVRVELVGSNLQVDATGDSVTLDVALRNADMRALYPMVRAWISALVPETVVPRGYDILQCPDSTRPVDCWYGWDYSQRLGDDGILSPGELSGARQWRFHAPALTSFAFAARVDIGLNPDLPRIAGLFFNDPNENGHVDPDEGAVGGGSVQIVGPGLDGTTVSVGEDGRWALRVQQSGLFTLIAVPPPTFAEVHFTTPNPLQVLLLPGADGSPHSFLHADFGMANGPPPGIYPPVQFTDAPDSLPHAFYSLLAFRPELRVLRLRVGFSGCDSNHPLSLYMAGGFAADPVGTTAVKAKLILSHDALGQPCLAYWEKELGFDLRPILRARERRFGTPGPVECVFVDFQGAEHRFLLAP